MDNDFIFLTALDAQKQQTIAELKECNDITLRYGLLLSDKQIANIVEKRFEALKETGRIEFGQGILKKLIYEFCDCPYITQDNYEETLCELQDSFYYFKNESMDIATDDEIISFMRYHFDSDCQGSVEYLRDVALEDLCRYVRSGGRPDLDY